MRSTIKISGGLICSAINFLAFFPDRIDDENEFDMDDDMDEAAEFDLPDNIDLVMENEDEVDEKTENKTKKEEEIDEENDLDYCDFPVDGGMIEERERERERERGRGKGRRKGNVGPPTSTDWDKVKLYVSFLKVFYVATLKFSGSLYVTCNAFFDEMVLIQQAIKKLCATNDSVLYPLARGMSAKFDKYWENFEKINPMMLYAVVLDPRCKVGFFEYCFLNTLGFDKRLVSEMTDKITRGITELFEWYVSNNASVNARNREDVGGASNKVDLGSLDDQKSLKSLFKMHQQNETNMASKSEREVSIGG
ncbi:hypothetical protein Vadar_004351 [Vaccinium darrowii]|uniref:Uncharacterized protein n=1 Tax=Vaccinium darrowii TaxID=229202 RepID=A0ACB7XFM8_9ERIC|nr:hypothetical protein Vadar_004351 [Vaccinium darrowii]